MSVNIPQDLAPYVSPELPKAKRLMAARGLLPLKPEQMAMAYYVLAHAPEPDVVETAKKSLSDMPPNILKGALGKASDPDALAFYAALRRDDESLEAIIANPATSTETLTQIARDCSAYVQGVLVSNQRRMLEDPTISEALLENPRLGGDLRAQVVEFRESFLGIAPGEEAPEAGAEDEMEMLEGGDLGMENLEVLEGEDLGLAAAGDLDDEDDFPDELLSEIHGAQDEQSSKNLQAMLGNMSISQKVRLAGLGNKAVRALLVRDANRLVATAVLRNPRMQDDEIEDFSKNRNLDDNVLRLIAGNKKWIKSYGIKKNLVENPKCPSELSMRLITALNQKDQDNLAKNRNVPTAVRNAARRMKSMREEKERRKKEKK